MRPRKGKGPAGTGPYLSLARSVQRRAFRPGPVRGQDPLTDDQPVFSGADMDRLAVHHLARQNHLGEGVLQVALNHPLERARTVDRVIARIAQPVFGVSVQLQRDLALRQTRGERGQCSSQ